MLMILIDSHSEKNGRLVAYHEVLSLLVSQAESFQLPKEDLHLQGFDPDRDPL
jgi:hypothetical protein